MLRRCRLPTPERRLRPARGRERGIRIALALGAGLAFRPGAAAAEPLRFTSQFTPIPTAVAPQGVAIGDLDGDGHADLVFTSAGANAAAPDSLLHVLLGDSTGALRAAGSFTVGTLPAGVTLSDLNGDGKLDAIAAASGRRTVSILAGNGDGTFGEKRDLPAGHRPIHVLARDLDGDGRPDLAVVNLGTGAQPPGTLQAVASGDSAWSDSSGVQVYLTGGASAAKGAKRGAPAKHQATPRASAVALPLPAEAGAARFAARFELSGGVQCVGVDAGDLNGDGKLDLVTAHRASGEIAVWHATPGGYERGRSLDTGMQLTFDVALADVDRDGALDVVQLGGPDPDHAVLSVLLAARAFAAQQMPLDPLHPSRLQLADLDGNGILDVLGLCHGVLCTLAGRGDGSFAAPVPLWLETGNFFALGKLDGDPHPDVVVSTWRSKALQVVRGNGDGTFGSAVDLPAGANPGHVLAADVTGDGRADLLTADTGAATISVLDGRAEGGFAPRRSFPASQGVQFLACGDLDADGDLDLLSMAVRGRASEVASYRNQGGGAFDRPHVLAMGADPSALVLADVNGDRKLDLLLPRSTQPDILLYLGGAGGNFQAPRHVTVPHTANLLAAADLNGDGKQDLVIADTRQSLVTVLLGAGDATFTAAPVVRSKYELGSLAVADMNRDGKPDLVLWAPAHVERPARCWQGRATARSGSAPISRSGSPVGP